MLGLLLLIFFIGITFMVLYLLWYLEESYEIEYRKINELMKKENIIKRNTANQCKNTIKNGFYDVGFKNSINEDKYSENECA